MGSNTADRLAWNAAVDQSLRDAVQRQSVFDVPCEDLAHNVRGIVIDLETGWISRSMSILTIRLILVMEPGFAAPMWKAPSSRQAGGRACSPERGCSARL
jgi:hypothetical protein